MPSLLTTLRQTPQLTPPQFLAAHSGCWIQYYDDTTVKDSGKALSARSFNAAVARRKQQDRCAICFSLQAFAESLTKEALFSFRNLGADVDLLSAVERRTLTLAEIEQRKEEYLARCLLPFPLKPHWLIETRHGFHVIFHIRPQRQPEGVREALSLNRRLVVALRGDQNAALLTQVLRVPGTLQFKDPEHPFLCRLLINNAGEVAPYSLDVVRSILDAREIFYGTVGRVPAKQPSHRPGQRGQTQRWREGLCGVPEGQRNVSAAAVVGAILGRLPEDLWETAGWGGLKEWNQLNAVPLPDRELRSVFESIARRERTKRQRVGRASTVAASGGLRVEVRIGIEISKPPRDHDPREAGDMPQLAEPSVPSTCHAEH